MAIRLYSEFKSDNGTQYKIEIHDASWVAAATTFNVDSRGFDLIYEGETDDIVSPIVSSRLTFGAYSENATFETFINTLKTFQENRFQLAVRKYNGASYDLIWAGWITQDLVSVEDESQPYIYEITATDGIGRLSNIDYTTANTISQANGFKATDIIAILKTAFVNIGTSDLWGAGDAFFETSIDWWETNYQTYATSTDPISQHAVDVRLFNEFDDDGNVVYSSTLDILRQIATLYNGRFYMQNGRFVFEQYGNRDTASRYVSRYTKSATHLGRVLVSDDKTIDQTANAARRSGNGWDFLPATQTARVHYVQKFLNPFNAFGLFRFRNSTNAYTAGFIAGGSGIQLSIGSTSFNFKVTGSVSTTSPIFPVFKMRIRIQDSSTGTYYYYNRSYNGVAAGGAMFGTPAWSTTSGFYYFDLPPFFTSGVSVVNQPVSIITDDMPVNGELDFQLTLHGVFRSKNGTTYTPSTTPLFDSIFVFGIQTNGSANAPGATFSSNNTTAGIDSKLTLDLGDLFIADGPRQTGHLAVFTGADWVGTSDWRKGSSGASLPILKLLTNETLALHVNPIEQYNGNVITSTLFGQRLVFNSAAYLMTGGTFNASSDEWSGTWYKIESVRANVTALTPVSDLVQKATIATATTSGSSSNDIIGGRIGGMVVDIEDQKIGPFQQTASGARLVGNTEITGTLDVDGAAQFNNDVNITGSVTSTGPLTGEYIQLDTTYNTTPIQGQIVWSQDDGTIDVGLNSNVTMQVGQEQFWFVKNQTGSTIPKGTAVRAAGTLGASGRILGAPMVADGSVPARFFLGIAAEDILNGGDGYVTTFGKIRQLNTSAFTEGSVLWCNPAVAGGLTSTEPSAPNLKLAVAFVVRSNTTSGVLAVRSEIGARVSDASDVQITSVADNDLLQYNTSTSRWENVAGTTTNIAEGTNLYYTDARSRAAISETIDGVSYNNTTGVFSLDAGRVIVTTTQTGEWDTAYNDRIVSAAVTGTTSKTLTLTQGDGGTITATWSDYDTAPVTSVNGLTGDVVLTTTNIGEGTNLYFTDARARAALSAGVGISYNNGTGVITNSAPDQVVAITASTAIAVTGTYPNFTIENTAPDQVVAVTAGTGISVTGTYPNFTITNTSPSSGGTITGGGTTNYLSKWTGASALGDSLVFDNGTNVGIGTTLPGTLLHLVQSSGPTIRLVRTSNRFDITADNDFMELNARDASTYMIFKTADTERMRITSAGNVGIGTTAPGAKLQVGGAAKITGGDWPTADAGLELNYTSNTSFVGSYDRTNSVYKKLFFFGEDTTFETQGSVRMYITSGGNVGIGTTSPNEKLDVNGDVTLGWSANRAFKIKFYGGGTYEAGMRLASGTRRLELFSIFDDSAEGISFTTGTGASNSEKMRLTDAGNLGIGTTAPINKLDIVDGALRVVNSLAGGEILAKLLAYTPAPFGLVIRGENTGATTIQVQRESNNAEVFALSLQPNGGNVGIGTTAPGAKLDVVGAPTTNDWGLRLQNTNTGGWGVSQFFNIYGYASSPASDFSALQIRADYPGYGRISFVVKEQAQSSALESLVLRGNGQVYMNAGNVGIGTTNPTQLLQVAGNEVTASKINAVGTIYGSGAFLNAFSSAGGNDVGFAGFIASQANQTNRMWTGVHSPSGANQAFIGTPDSMPLAFWTNSAEQMRITSAGNVGIGTTAPGAKLEIAGTNSTLALSFGNSVPNNPLFVNTYGGFTGIGMDQTTAGLRLVGDSGGNNLVDVGYYSGNVVAHANWVSRMRVLGNGNVGIGTTAPNQRLSVEGGNIQLNANNAAANYYLFLNKKTGQDGGIIFNRDNNNDWQLTNHSSLGDLVFYSYGTASEAITFKKGTGNVGIGTTAPTARLTIGANTSVQSTNGIALGVGETSLEFVHATFQNGFGSKLYSVDSGNGITSLRIATRPNSTSWSDAVTIIAGTSGNGNVGIGTAAPVAELNVVGTSTEQLVISYDSTKRMILGRTNGYGWIQPYTSGVSYDNLILNRDGGNVGIGTTAPIRKLHIDGGSITSDTPTIRISSTDGSGTRKFGIEFYSNTGADVRGKLMADNSGKVYLDDNGGGGVILQGNGGTGNVGIGTTSPLAILDVYQAGQPQLRVRGTTGANHLYQDSTTGTTINDGLFVGIGSDQTGYIYHYESNPLVFATSNAERMRITAGGNVGIGTTAPVTPLQVVSATNAVDVLRIGNTAGNSGSVQAITHLAINHFNAGTNPSTRITAYQDGLSGWPGGMYFSTRSVNTDSAPVERMRITSGGLVGIGTSFPSHILHITDVMRMDNVSAYSPNLTEVTPKFGYGDTENQRYLAEPTIWFKINVDGTEYVIPGYTEVI